MSAATEGGFAPTSKRGPALLREVLAVIESEISAEYSDLVDGTERHGGRWDQRDWGAVPLSQRVRDAAVETELASWRAVPAAVVLEECGTTACVAGHAALLVGDRPLIDPETLDGSPGMTVSWASVLPVDGQHEGRMTAVQNRARELLDLSVDQAQNLFDGENSIDAVRYLIREILENRL